MIVRLNDNLIVTIAETREEQTLISVWARASNGNIFVLCHQDEFRLIGLGAEHRRVSGADQRQLPARPTRGSSSSPI
jgi:hypothetical protein